MLSQLENRSVVTIPTLYSISLLSISFNILILISISLLCLLKELEICFRYRLNFQLYFFDILIYIFNVISVKKIFNLLWMWHFLFYFEFWEKFPTISYLLVRIRARTQGTRSRKGGRSRRKGARAWPEIWGTAHPVCIATRLDSTMYTWRSPKIR